MSNTTSSKAQMSNMQISNSTRNVVDLTLEALAKPVNESNKVVAWSDNRTARSVIHSLVVFVYCHSLRFVIQSSNMREGDERKICTHVNRETGEIECGYVIGVAIYRYILSYADPQFTYLQNTCGCGYYHDPATTQPFINGIISYLRQRYGNPAQHQWFGGISRITSYISKVIISLHTNDYTNMGEFKMPKEKPVYVVDVSGKPFGSKNKIIAADDSIFDDS